jgi:hypothetical protein
MPTVKNTAQTQSDISGNIYTNGNNLVTAAMVASVLQNISVSYINRITDAPLLGLKAFSTTTAYAVGDCCVYSGVLYQCSTAHTGAWNAGDFTEVIGSSTVTLTGIQTLTNKTLTSPILNFPTINVGSDATGDMYYRNVSNQFVRLPIGTTGQVLSVNSGIPYWATAASAPVSSVFGRTGAVVGSAADYNGIAMTGIASLNGLVITANTGVVTTGTWNGTKVSEVYGGTNQSSYTTGDILYASGTNTLAKLGIGAAGQLLTVTGGLPSWVTASSGAVITDISASVTFVGWSSFTTKKVIQIVIGSFVCIQYELIGTSNSATTTMTLPNSNSSLVRMFNAIGYAQGSGGGQTGLTIMAASTGLVTFYTDANTTAYPSSGTKIAIGQFFYTK